MTLTRQYLVIYWVMLPVGDTTLGAEISRHCRLQNLTFRNVSQFVSTTRAMSVVVCRCEELQIFILKRTKPGPL